MKIKKGDIVLELTESEAIDLYYRLQRRCFPTVLSCPTGDRKVNYLEEGIQTRTYTTRDDWYE